MLNENKQIPKVPNLPEYQRDSMDEFFEDVKFLTSFIGCNIFEIIKTKEQQDLHLFYTTGRGYNAKGYYNASGFTVLKGSMIKKDSVPSLNWKVKRELLIKRKYIPNKVQIVPNNTPHSEFIRRSNVVHPCSYGEALNNLREINEEEVVS